MRVAAAHCRCSDRLCPLHPGPQSQGEHLAAMLQISGAASSANRRPAGSFSRALTRSRMTILTPASARASARALSPAAGARLDVGARDLREAAATTASRPSVEMTTSSTNPRWFLPPFRAIGLSTVGQRRSSYRDGRGQRITRSTCSRRSGGASRCGRVVRLILARNSSVIARDLGGILDDARRDGDQKLGPGDLVRLVLE